MQDVKLHFLNSVYRLDTMVRYVDAAWNWLMMSACWTAGVQPLPCVVTQIKICSKIYLFNTHTHTHTHKQTLVLYCPTNAHKFTSSAHTHTHKQTLVLYCPTNAHKFTSSKHTHKQILVLYCPTNAHKFTSSAHTHTHTHTQTDISSLLSN